MAGIGATDAGLGAIPIGVIDAGLIALRCGALGVIALGHGVQAGAIGAGPGAGERPVR